MTTRKTSRSQTEPTAGSTDALTAGELRALNAEPLPSREAMSTLIWAPGPATVIPDAPIGPVETESV